LSGLSSDERKQRGREKRGNFKCPANKKNTRLGNEIASAGKYKTAATLITLL